MKTHRHPTEEPIMKDHAELDRPPQHEESLTAAVVQVETGAGMVTPSQEAAMPVGARVINKTPPREGEITPGGEDPRKA